MKKTTTKLLLVAAMFLSAGVIMNSCKDPVTPEPDPPTVSITEVEGIPHQRSVTVSFQASETAVSYTYAIGTANDLTAFEDGTIEGCTTVSEDVQTAKSVTFSDLEPDTEYTVFAQATGAGGITGEVFTKKMRTMIDPPVSVDITQGEVTITSIEVVFEASEYAVSYAYAIGTADDLVAFEAGTIESYTVVTEDVLEAKTVTFSDLEPETEYTIFAHATNAGNVTGDTETVTVTTPEASVPRVETEFIVFNSTVATVKYRLKAGATKAISALVSLDYFNSIDNEQFYEHMLTMAGTGAASLYEEDIERTWWNISKPEQEFKMVDIVFFKNEAGVETFRRDVRSVFTPAFNPNAPEPAVDVEILTNERLTLALRFTTQPGTYYFRHSLMSKANWDVLMAMPQMAATLYNDLLTKSGNPHREGVSTYTYDHTGMGGIRAGDVTHIIGIMFNENGPTDDIRILGTFTVPN